MPAGTSPTPSPDRWEIERELQERVEEARAAMQRASDPAERAEAAGRLKTAVRDLMAFTFQKEPGSAG